MAEEYNDGGHPDYRQSDTLQTDEQKISQQAVLCFFLFPAANIFSLVGVGSFRAVLGGSSFRLRLLR
jgi:hypothetical protein